MLAQHVERLALDVSTAVLDDVPPGRAIEVVVCTPVLRNVPKGRKTLRCIPFAPNSACLAHEAWKEIRRGSNRSGHQKTWER